MKEEDIEKYFLTIILRFYMYPLGSYFAYGRLKSVTSEVVPSVDGTWQGTKLSMIEYKGANFFVFGRPKVKATPFIPDFMDGNPLYFNPVDFRTICL